MTIYEALVWCSLNNSTVSFGPDGRVWLDTQVWVDPSLDDPNFPSNEGTRVYTFRKSATDIEPAVAIIRAVGLMERDWERIRRREVTLEELDKEQKERNYGSVLEQSAR